MTSIRFYLVAVTLACITLINFLSALHGYYSSMTAAEKLFDSKLAEMARLVTTTGKITVQENIPLQPENNSIAFQIWQNDTILRSRSANTPETPIAPFSNGFYDRNFTNFRWRVYAHYDESHQQWTFIAERSDIRYDLAEKVILESILPTLFGLPLVAVFIWFIVTLGIKPLNKLSMQLRNKEADDLTPVTLETVPEEMRPLLRSTNELLKRLEDSFLREKRFAADAAHELRTPISVLKVHLYNLQTEWPNQIKALQPLQEGIERMSHLVEQILALYRTSPDQYMAKFEDIELMALAQSTIATCYNLFDDKQQHIVLDGKISHLTGDKFALETLLQNLLANASKYSPAQSEILVTVKSTGEHVVLQIEDSGPGIPENKYERVFERFYRINEDHRQSEVVGCGLGLAIVKHIAELHAATIKFGPSCFDNGLSVTIEFPK